MIDWRSISHAVVCVAVFASLALSQRVKTTFFVWAGYQAPSMMFVASLGEGN